MGNKSYPDCLRLGIKGSNTPKYSVFCHSKKNYYYVYEDYIIRQTIDKSPQKGLIVEIVQISRQANKVSINITVINKTVFIGPDGAEIKNLKSKIEKAIERSSKTVFFADKVKKEVIVTIVEKYNKFSPIYIANTIISLIEQRKDYKRTVRSVIQEISSKYNPGQFGIRVEVAGRINGALIARNEVFYLGSIKRQQFNCFIQTYFGAAKVSYGVCGVKVFIRTEDNNAISA